MIPYLLMGLGNLDVAPPVGGGSSGKDLDLVVSRHEYEAAHRRAENNARIAILLAAMEADEL